MSPSMDPLPNSLYYSACSPTVWVFRGDLGDLANAFTFTSQMASVWVEVKNQIFLSLRTQDRTEKNNNAAERSTSE